MGYLSTKFNFKHINEYDISSVKVQNKGNVYQYIVRYFVSKSRVKF